ncbi:MAG: hypothetical protein ACXW2E_01625 [Nitrososphaeraceae archaeon]
MPTENFRIKKGITIGADTETAPIVTSSTVLVLNLNADLLDGQEGSYYLNLSNATGILSLANGGTGQATANDSLNALLPSQTGNSGKVLSTDGTDSSWTTLTSIPPTVINQTTSVLNTNHTSGIVYIHCDCSSTNITINLNTAVNNAAIFIIKKTDSSSNTVTVDGSTTETIDGGETAIIAVQYESISLISNNSNWEIF